MYTNIQTFMLTQSKRKGFSLFLQNIIWINFKSTYLEACGVEIVHEGHHPVLHVLEGVLILHAIDQEDQVDGAGYLATGEGLGGLQVVFGWRGFGGLRGRLHTVCIIFYFFDIFKLNIKNVGKMFKCLFM